MRIKLPLYGQLKEHVSFSELRLFNECNWKWLLLKVFNRQIEDRSFQMDFGKAVHSGMEMLYGPDGGDPVRAAFYALLIYDQSLATMPDMHPTDAAEAERLRHLLPAIFRDSLLCPDLQGIKPLKSELQLYEEIKRTDGLDVKFKGFIDIIYVRKLPKSKKSVIYIADFKTCQWGWPAKKFQDIEVISQILLYKHFFCKITGADPRNVSTAFILLKKKPKKDDLCVEVAKIGSGPKAIESALSYMQRSITAMHSYSYEQNFEVCKRSWTDGVTKEERTAQCPFLGTEMCPQSELKAAVT